MPQTKVANGNIVPYTVVMIDTSNTNGRVIEATAGARSFGIAQAGTRRPPGSFLGIDDGYVAIAGEGFMVYVDGDKDVPIRLGGTVTAGQRIKAGTNGYGVASTSNTDQFIGTIKRDGVSGDIGILDQVTIGEVSI